MGLCNQVQDVQALWTFSRGQPLRPLEGLGTLWHLPPGRIGNPGRKEQRKVFSVWEGYRGGLIEKYVQLGEYIVFQAGCNTTDIKTEM